MKLLVFALALLVATASAQADQWYLTVGATDASPAGIAKKAKRIAADGLIFQTGDCGDKKNIFGWAAKVDKDRKSAEATRRALRERVPDANVRLCEVKQGSLLAHRISAVDISIADVPETAVNWDDRDMVSEIESLPDNRSLLISRYYERGADDPLEGRRERVILLSPQDERKELEKNCINAGNVRSSRDLLAFQCAREQAGDHLLHIVVVFDWNGAKIKEIRHCRDPLLIQNSYLQCQRESVGADGKLKLSTKKIRLH